MDLLHPQQFTQAYQRPLPGMEHLGANPMLPVENLFSHSYQQPHPEENRLLNTASSTEQLDPKTLHPTQPWVNEGYMHGDQSATGLQRISVVRNAAGQNLIADGHHRAARSLLSGGNVEASVHYENPADRPENPFRQSGVVSWD